MKTSAKKISEFAIIALMLLANLSCTKDLIKPNITMDPLGPGIWKVKPLNSDSTIGKDVETTASSKKQE